MASLAVKQIIVTDRSSSPFFGLCLFSLDSTFKDNELNVDTEPEPFQYVMDPQTESTAPRTHSKVENISAAQAQWWQNNMLLAGKQEVPIAGLFSARFLWIE